MQRLQKQPLECGAWKLWHFSKPGRLVPGRNGDSLPSRSCDVSARLLPLLYVCHCPLGVVFQHLEDSSSRFSRTEAPKKRLKQKCVFIDECEHHGGFCMFLHWLLLLQLMATWLESTSQLASTASSSLLCTQTNSACSSSSSFLITRSSISPSLFLISLLFRVPTDGSSSCQIFKPLLEVWWCQTPQRKQNKSKTEYYEP